MKTTLLLVARLLLVFGVAVSARVVERHGGAPRLHP
jgi:hypothetical protein